LANDCADRDGQPVSHRLIQGEVHDENAAAIGGVSGTQEFLALRPTSRRSAKCS